jgi:small subunit ribosomal protein S5
MSQYEAGKSEEKNYELITKMVRIARTSKVVKGGRQFSISALVVVGDGVSSLGCGRGKAKEVRDAIQKATDNAKKSMFKVSLKGRTIQHAVVASHGATKVFMKAAAMGTGVIAGGAMRAIFECLGVEDVLAKCIGSSNPVNVTHATIKALKAQQDPQKTAHIRGVPVRHVLGIAQKESSNA